MSSTISYNSNFDNLENKKIFARGCLIWGLATLFYSFDNLLNVSPGAMKPELSRAFSLSASELGILSSCYLWPYAIMQIPAGLLMDKYGPRIMLTIASLFCAVGSYLFSEATVLSTAQLGRICIGIGASFTVVGCTKISSMWFTPRRFASFMGIMVAVGMLGAAFGLATVSSIVDSFGWRYAMLLGAIFSLVIGALMWLIVRNSPNNSQNLSAPDELISEAAFCIWQGLKQVVCSNQAWIAAIYAGLMFIPTLSFGGLWGTPFMVEAHGFSQQDAGYLASLIFIGWVFGGPIYGFISDQMGKRNPAMYFANITTLIISLIIIYSTNLSFNLAAILMFALGFFSSGFIIAFAAIRESNHAKIAGTAIGFMNTFNTLFVAAAQWAIGEILDNTAKGVTLGADGINMFSLQDYQHALLTIPCGLVVSLALIFFLKETNAKPMQ